MTAPGKRLLELASLLMSPVVLYTAPADCSDFTNQHKRPSDTFMLRRLLQTPNNTTAPFTSGWDSLSESERIGIIVGYAIGGLIIIAAAIITVYCCCRRRLANCRRRTVTRTRELKIDEDGNTVRTTRTEITEIIPKHRESGISNKRCKRNDSQTFTKNHDPEEPVTMTMNAICEADEDNKMPRDTDSFGSEGVRHDGGSNPGYTVDVDY